MAEDDLNPLFLECLDIVDADGNIIGGYFGLPHHLIEQYKTILEKKLPAGHAMRTGSMDNKRCHPLFQLLGEVPATLTPEQEFLIDELLHGPIGGQELPPAHGKSYVQSMMDEVAERLVEGERREMIFDTVRKSLPRRRK